MKRLFWLFVLTIATVAVFATPALAFKISVGKIGLGLEKAIGQSGASQLEKEKGLVSNPALVSRVQNVASRLIPLISRKEIDYQVKILNDWQFNACALPGGYVYVNRGLLEYTVSDNELAYVLAHEFTHISEKHGFKRLEKFAGLALLGQLLGEKVSESDVAKLAAAAILANYSRQDEKESDLKGIELMTKAGFDPAGALTSMRRMETLHKDQPDIIERLVASHPAPQDRSEYLKDFAVQNRYGITFKEKDIVDFFDWPVGPLDDAKQQGLSLDRENLRDGGWHVSQGWLETSHTGLPHVALDVNWGSGAADFGKPVFAVARGVVIGLRQFTNRTDDLWRGIVLLKHTLPDGKTVASQYAHLQDLKVKRDDIVQRGQLVGRIGPTPKGSTGPHLHFEIRDNLAIKIDENPYRKDSSGWLDPEDFIKKHRRLGPVTAPRENVLLESGPLHLGDDTPESQTMWMKEFALTPEDLEGRGQAIVRLKVKATPRKDPVVSFNRVEVGRAVTRQVDWQQFEFSFDPKILRPGNNLIDLETVIPDLRQTFDDCEVSDIELLLR